MEDEEELVAVLDHYDLGAICSIHRVDHGYVNETWVVETSTGSCVLRRRHPSLAKPRLIVAQHALVGHLRGAGFPAPRVLRTLQGPTFLVVQDRVYEVQQYLPGDLCDATRPAHITAAAHTLGQYHRAVAGFDHVALHRTHERYGAATLASIVWRLIDEWEGRVDAQVDGLCRLLLAHQGELEARFGECGSWPELVIHGDYYAENLIVQGDAVVGVVDYDLAHWCWRALEVAEALIYFAREREERLEHIVYSGVLDLGAVERFLATYSTVIRLSDAEIRALPHLVRTIWMCASLAPPLRPRPSAQAAPQVLREVLYLADWAQAHAAEIVEIGFAAREGA